MSNVDINRIKNKALNLSSEIAGKIAFSQITGISLGKTITSGIIKSAVAGTVLGFALTIGASSSRAIYTSRKLKMHNQDLYYKLRNNGNLDLLYFLIEDKLSPFVNACLLSKKNKEEFNKVCDIFFTGV